MAESSKIPPAPAVRWTLQSYTRRPARLPLICSDLTLPHSIVCIGGLTDTLGTLGWLERLTAGVAPFGFSVTQVQLSSSLGGFGYCSLEGDAQEIALAVKWLREKGKDKIILMGHSTGCQDVMQYLSYPDRGEDARVDAGILQAPVSDREHWEHGDSDDDPEEIENLKKATELVEQGKGFELMPRKVKPQLPGSTSEGQGNVGAVEDPPMTAYRYWSLYAQGADDDFFSTLDFSQEKMRGIWEKASAGLTRNEKGYILALIGAEDECIPQPTVTAEGIKKAWEEAVKGSSKVRADFQVLPLANHAVEKPEAQILLVSKVRELIKALGVPLQATKSIPASRAPAAAATGAGASTRKVGPPPSLTSGIPAWQLTDENAPSQAAAPSSSSDPASASHVAAAPSAVPPHPPSFDALVELIASGRTDEIEGIRDIPLKINDEAPSESSMSIPKKPWEAQSQS